MNYRSVADLGHDVRRNLHRLPRDLDVVVGIPRSGLLAASLVALALNLPLADLDGFVEGRLLASGKTRRRPALDRGFAELRHALLLDDSIHTGGSMAEARARLAALPPGLRVTASAIYAAPDSLGLVDLAFEIVPQPRVFEWNLMHHDVLATACVDIDGVLCVDPTQAENDDGAEYLNFLATARPLYSPTKRIGTLVTSRLEKYRTQTEAWLAAHDVAYDRLVMLDLPDAATRRRLNAHAGFKAGFYRASTSPLFIESEVGQARRIAGLSGKDVLCVADHQMYRAGALSPIRGAQRLRQSSRLRRAVRALLGDTVRARLGSAFGFSGMPPRR